MSLLSANPNYNDFKKLALKRIREAMILFKKEQYSGAYYLAGYAIEFALKACYCKGVKNRSFPPKKDIYSKLYSHDLNDLLIVSGVKSEFDERARKRTTVQSNWNTIKDWTEESRYAFCDKGEAKSLIDAIEDKQNGILIWIKKVW